MNDTTKRFPRSTREAFNDASYACAVERPRYDVTRVGHRVVMALSIIGMVVIVGLLFGGM